jgi:hypothetical protein
MEEAARIIAKAFSNCITDRFAINLHLFVLISQLTVNLFRTSPPDQSRKWGIYYVVGLILKSYFKVSDRMVVGFGEH